MPGAIVLIFALLSSAFAYAAAAAGGSVGSRATGAAAAPAATIVQASNAAGGGNDIYIINADGSGYAVLTGDASAYDSPSWSPDGRLAFDSDRDGNREVYVINPDDAPDTNFDGYDFWLSKLDHFSRPGEDMRRERDAAELALRAEMVRAFIVSTEYLCRFAAR